MYSVLLVVFCGMFYRINTISLTCVGLRFLSETHFTAQKTHPVLLSSWSNFSMALPLLSTTSSITTTLYWDMIWEKQSQHNMLLLKLIISNISFILPSCAWKALYRFSEYLGVTLVRWWTTVLFVTFFMPRFLALKAAIFIFTLFWKERWLTVI